MSEIEDRVKLNGKTLLSLHVVALAIGFTMWITRLSDRVDTNERDIKALAAQCLARMDKHGH